MSLFGTSTATTSTPLFGTATSTAGASKPLFGTPTTAAAPSGGLFGATSTPATSTAPLFGATSTPAASSGGLFGATSTPATSTAPLFGATSTPAASSGGLFGATSTPAAATPSGGGLFGSKPATTAPAATGGLFGSSTTTPALNLGTSTATTGGLFGAKPVTSTAPTLGGGLFGSTTPAATTTPFGASTATTTPSLGLGGVQQNATTTNAAGNTVNSLTGADKDTTKDGEVQAINFLREMLPLIEDKLKKNRDLMEETENMSSVDSMPIDDMIDKTRGWISEVRRNVRSATEASKNVALLVANDKLLLETAKRVQEQSATANQTTHAQFIKNHLAERTAIYDLEMRALQNRVNDLRVKFEKLLKGEPSLSMSELDEYFRRCDSNVAYANDSIIKLGREIEELKNQLIEQGFTHLRRSTVPNYSQTITSNVSEGAEFFPSRSSLAIIGSSLRAPAAAAPAVGGLGLGTGTGLFGGNTGGTTLFGSSTAAKPAFSGGSLFGNLNTAPATSTATSAPTTSLFGSKPATTTFASTVSNNSSGLLFSSKK